MERFIICLDYLWLYTNIWSVVSVSNLWELISLGSYVLFVKPEGNLLIGSVIRVWIRIRPGQVNDFIHYFDWRVIWVLSWRGWYVGSIVSLITVREFTCLFVQGDSIIQGWVSSMWHLDGINCDWFWFIWSPHYIWEI